MAERIVVFPGSGVVSPDTPVLRGDDAGVLYGDGVFETVHVRDSRPWLLDEHLDRMSRSAALLALPLPDLRPLALQACDAWDEPEGGLRLICTRGPADGPPTCYATITGVPAATLRERRDGVRVVTAGLGIAVGQRPPWLSSSLRGLAEVRVLDGVTRPASEWTARMHAVLGF